MIPNPNIYGSPDDWIFVPVNSGRSAGCKVAPWQTLGNAVLGWGDNPPVMDIAEPLDNSICFCGIGNDSPISTVYIIDYTARDINSSFTPQITNWVLSYYDSRYPVTLKNYDDEITYNDKVWSPQTELGSTNIHRFLRPIVSISPQDCVFLISIRAMNTQGGQITSALYEYESNYKDTYPIITTIYITPYTRFTENSPTRNPFEITNDYKRGFISRLIDYDIPDWGTVINYAIPCESQNETNMRVIVWGSDTSYNQGCDSVIGGDGDTVETIAGSTYLTHEYDRDWVLSCVACLGLFFTDRETVARNDPLYSEYMYCGTIDDNGITHGEYTRGADNRSQPQYNWESTNQSEYDPTKEVPDYDTKNHLNPYIAVADFNTEYVCNYQTVRQLCQELYKALSRKPSDVQTVDYSADTFLVTDPLSGIISIRKYPVDNVPHFNDEPYIKIGNYTSDTIKGYRFAPSLNTFITFTFSGVKRLNEVFDGSFLDREPYTTAELYIPFCGTVPISVADYIGHNITVKLAIVFIAHSPCKPK